MTEPPLLVLINTDERYATIRLRDQLFEVCEAALQSGASNNVVLQALIEALSTIRLTTRGRTSGIPALVNEIIRCLAQEAWEARK
jgi:hypothetical protein